MYLLLSLVMLKGVKLLRDCAVAMVTVANVQRHGDAERTPGGKVRNGVSSSRVPVAVDRLVSMSGPYNSTGACL